MPRRKKITADHLLGLPGLSEKARRKLLTLQPKTVADALRIRGIGRKTTRKLLELGLLTDPEGVQDRKRPPKFDEFIELQQQSFRDIGFLDLLGIKPLNRIVPPGGSAYMYTKPINMRWGEEKLTKLCTEEIGIDPKTGAVFLFFNKAMDKLKVFFLDDDGSQEFMKVMPKGGFMVPVAGQGQKYVKISGKMLQKLFR